MIYDNTNLAESYSGTTTPLTFTFARGVYARVYPHFLRMMGVTEDSIQTHRELFPNMLVFIGNTMYYNLSEWYRMIALLPGYESNKVFFDQMLGVSKEVTANTQEKSAQTQHSRLGTLRLLPQVCVIALNFLFMGLHTKRFNSQFDSVLSESKKRLRSSTTHDELVKLFQETEEQLLALWRIPIGNDFAVMVSVGLLTRVLSKAGRADELPLYLRLSSRTPLSALDPGRELSEIALLLQGNPRVMKLFQETDDAKVFDDILRMHPLVATRLNAYIAHYGSRTPRELKLESVTLTEQPHMLIGLLRQYVHFTPHAGEERLRTAYSGLLVSFLASWAHVSIARRESTRFRRSLIFGFARTISLRLGGILVERGALGDMHDVFYLTTDELLVADTLHTRKSYVDIVSERKKTKAHWSGETLPSRIVSDATISEIEREFVHLAPSLLPRERTLRGMPASFGAHECVEGEVLALAEFDPSASYEDKVLVTRFTDPGWTVVFPLLRAIVVERGGMLSHAAIVAREYNIPCIVSVSGALLHFATGDRVAIVPKDGTITLTHEK